MAFGQLVIGPPGSGKSTYCYGMYQFLQAVGRKTTVVNLDPANDRTNYPCGLDIRDFTTLEDVMDQENLGPNGGVMFALEEVEQSLDEFVEQLRKLGENEYLVFDCPGQVELFTHHSALQHIFKRLEKLDYRLVVVHLIDSFYITSPSQYVSVLLMALRSMLQLDLPHINVLSKIDLLKSYGKLPFNLDFYTEVQDLSHLFPLIEKESPTFLGQKFAKLSEAIAEVVDDYGLVNFEVLAVEDKKSMIALLSVIDRANGYLFGSTEIGGDTVWAEATRQGGYLGNSVADIQERWIDHKEVFDEAEAKEQEERMKEQEQNAPMSAEDEWQQALDDYQAQTGIRPMK
jgi:GTPase SAR1 family protein